MLLLKEGASLNIQDEVSTRIGYVYTNKLQSICTLQKTVVINKYDIIIYILSSLFYPQ
jgi:hypothetical protein